MNFGYVTYRQTDIQKVMHKSPPCIRTGGLKNVKGREIPLRHLILTKIN